MQLFTMYTESGNMRNFYLLLISFSSSTLLYVINIPKYHWQIHTCKEHVQKLCMSNLNLVTTL